MLRHVTATRYVTPLREGGSLPGLMEADDLGTYVVKYTGAGQGRKVLVAEIVTGELARGLGLPVPELVTVELDPALGVAEPDQEVQELLRASPTSTRRRSRSTPASPGACCGSTRSSATSTGRGATRTCSSGTAART